MRINARLDEEYSNKVCDLGIALPIIIQRVM